MDLNIPVIDVSSLRVSDAGNSVDLIAMQISKACQEHGFFYIKGHGVDVNLQRELEVKSHQFFALPEEEKMKIYMKLGGKAWRGFFPIGDELTSGKPDIKEGIYFGTELDTDHPKVKSGILLHGPNLFPEKPEGFKELIIDYMEQVTQVGHLVMKGIALSLGLDSNYFHDRYTKDPLVLFRIFHYPYQSPTNDELWGVGEHTDYGLLTILKQDGNGGLQVKSKGQWIDAPPLENTFICNIGDMLDKMTGGLYRSTPHRVLNTSGKNRLSFPLFFDPGFDTTPQRIKNIDTSTIDDYEDRWDKESVHEFSGTYGDYIIGKVSKVFPELEKRVL